MSSNSRAALNIEGTNETYFFQGTKYCVVNWTPGHPKEQKLVHGPNMIEKDWRSLREAGFKQVEAVLPIGNRMSYIFCGKKYCRVRDKEELVGKVQNISDGWPSLKKANFETVDVALRVPGHPRQAYFFSGSKFVRVEFEEGQLDDKIVDGPHPIHERWPKLPFSEVEMALPRPDNDQKGVYMFSGSNCVQLIIDVGGPDDEIVGDEESIAKLWPALKEAGFYH